MSKSKDIFVFVFCSIVILMHVDYVQSLRKFYMEDDCTGDIDMESADIPAGRLLVTRRHKYRSTLTCRVTIKAPPDKKIVVVFRDMDIEWEPNCGDDYVSLHDGPNSNGSILPGTRPRMCGNLIPSGNYVTSGKHLTVIFHSDMFKQDNGFEIVFTAFHKARPCFVDELQCDNGRCIAASLSCNDFNNCGDNSDECQVDTEVIVAIILSVLLLTVVAVGVILLYKKRKRKHVNKKHRDLKSAIIKASKTMEIHPCEACSLKIVSAEKKKRLAKQTQPSVAVENVAYVEDCSGERPCAYKEVLGCHYSNTSHRASI